MELGPTGIYFIHFCATCITIMLQKNPMKNRSGLLAMSLRDKSPQLSNKVEFMALNFNELHKVVYVICTLFYFILLTFMI